MKLKSNYFLLSVLISICVGLYLDYGTGMGNFIYVFMTFYCGIGVFFTWKLSLVTVKNYVPKQPSFLKLCSLTLTTLLIGFGLLYYAVSTYILNPFMIIKGKFDHYYWIFGCFYL